MSAISNVFSSSGKGVLVAYIMGGDPDLDFSLKAVGAAVEGGADIIELGIPFSDPIADGRSIQGAGVRALRAGTKPRDVIEMAHAVKKDYNVPVALMTYYNILFSSGVDDFVSLAKRNGVDGIIVPDLPLEESGPLRKCARKEGVDAIMLAAPTTPAARLKEIANLTSGFLYLVSLTGVTGTRVSMQRQRLELISRTKKLVAGIAPLAVGFGISKPEHVKRAIEYGADGVIVGSAIVDRIASGGKKKSTFTELGRFVGSLKRAAATGQT